jgi:CBS domain containing-hemolysin-like protein
VAKKNVSSHCYEFRLTYEFDFICLMTLLLYVLSWVAILLSVTLVLIFGEILPSAIFTGPRQLRLAAKFTGVVKFVMIIFYPIAYPLARLLDRILG